MGLHVCMRVRMMTLSLEEGEAPAMAMDLAIGGEKADSKPLQRKARKKAPRKPRKTGSRKGKRDSGVYVF